MPHRLSAQPVRQGAAGGGVRMGAWLLLDWLWRLIAARLLAVAPAYGGSVDAIVVGSDVGGLRVATGGFSVGSMKVTTGLANGKVGVTGAGGSRVAIAGFSVGSMKVTTGLANGKVGVTGA